MENSKKLNNKGELTKYKSSGEKLANTSQQNSVTKHINNDIKLCEH